MARRRDLQRFVTVLVAVGALLVPAAPAPAAENEVKLAAIFDLSGPTADAGTPWSEGVRDYVEWYNANRASDAKTVALQWADFGYKVPQAEQHYQQFTSEGAVGFIGWGVADTEALRPRVNVDKVPFMSAAYPESLVNPRENPYIFVDGTTWSDQMRIALGWIAKQEAGNHTEVAVFHHDSPFGTSPVEDGRKYVAEHKLDLGYQTYPMPAGATDFVAELEKAKVQGATYVVVQNVTSPAAKLAQNIADGRYGMRMLCLNSCGDERLVNLAGPAAESVLAVMPFAAAGSDAPGLRVMREHLAANGKKLEDQGVHYVQGWFTMAAMVSAAVAAEARGPAIKERLESSDGLDTGNVCTGPIKFTADSHKGLQGARIFQVNGGRWEPVTDPLAP